MIQITYTAECKGDTVGCDCRIDDERIDDEELMNRVILEGVRGVKYRVMELVLKHEGRSAEV